MIQNNYSESKEEIEDDASQAGNNQKIVRQKKMQVSAVHLKISAKVWIYTLIVLIVIDQTLPTHMLARLFRKLR